MGSIGANKGTSVVPAEVQERRDRSTRARSLGLPQDTLGQLATANFDDEGLEDAIRRGWITQEQANTISNNTVKNVSIPKSQVEIDDTTFKTYNGRPSGTGTWSFDIDGQDVFYSGKYSSAKARAIEEAARRGIRRIKLNT